MTIRKSKITNVAHILFLLVNDRLDKRFTILGTNHIQSLVPDSLSFGRKRNLINLAELSQGIY